jgi:hypothetical protein
MSVNVNVPLKIEAIRQVVLVENHMVCNGLHIWPSLFCTFIYKPEILGRSIRQSPGTAR